MFTSRAINLIEQGMNIKAVRLNVAVKEQKIAYDLLEHEEFIDRLKMAIEEYREVDQKKLLSTMKNCLELLTSIYMTIL
ncbi:hypothetical protein [Dolosigranulum pigrum]|uniref:hypothetical protein n=1 Tax=Dolosigranulum pigrum TaxID=29394 RepID=UPI001AD87918|nr:hypothetical protein [Dolosigranulum pigrum]QTJ35925.1 hypothetical protein FE323_02545 [Dolosigranulum pigrum]